MPACPKKKHTRKGKQLLLKLLRKTKVVSSFLAILFLASSCSTGPTIEYKIGIDPSWYPLDLTGKEKNVLAFSTELLQQISQHEKIQITQVIMSWDNLLGGLQKRQYDGMLSSMQPYLFTQNQYDCSELYLQTGPVLIVSASSSVNSLSLLNGKEVAVQDETGINILEKYPGIIIRTYDSIPKALNDVLTGTIDGALVNAISAYAYCNDLYQGQLKVATSPLNSEGLRLVTLHGEAGDLMQAFNDGLKQMQKSGHYNELLKKWGLTQ